MACPARSAPPTPMSCSAADFSGRTRPGSKAGSTRVLALHTERSHTQDHDPVTVQSTLTARASYGPGTLMEGRQTIPVELFRFDGHNWLVSIFGETGWVRALRETGVVRLRRGRHTETFTAVEVDGEQSTAVVAQMRRQTRMNPLVRGALRAGTVIPCSGSNRSMTKMTDLDRGRLAVHLCHSRRKGAGAPRPAGRPALWRIRASCTTREPALSWGTRRC